MSEDAVLSNRIVAALSDLLRDPTAEPVRRAGGEADPDPTPDLSALTAAVATLGEAQRRALLGGLQRLAQDRDLLGPQSIALTRDLAGLREEVALLRPALAEALEERATAATALARLRRQGEQVAAGQERARQIASDLRAAEEPGRPLAPCEEGRGLMLDPERPIAFAGPVRAGEEHLLRSRFPADRAPEGPTDCVLTFAFFDAAGAPLPPPYRGGITQSRAIGPYQYIRQQDAGDADIAVATFVNRFRAPPDAASVRIGYRVWRPDGYQPRRRRRFGLWPAAPASLPRAIQLAGPPALVDETRLGQLAALLAALPDATTGSVFGAAAGSAAIPLAALPAPPLPRRADRPRVAAIMDEFTEACYRPDCEFLALSPQAWRAELEAFKPELLFVESAWHGNQGQWTQQVSRPSEALRDLLAWCRQSGIPSIFWNKEDPVHFATFLATAALCDLVFTTDLDCIPRYKAALGHDRVYLLPFAAQPQLQNPIEEFSRKDGFCFAGSYYLRYPERQRDMDRLLDTVMEFGPVEIYDRNHDRQHPHYLFPERYRHLVLGSLPFAKINLAYKGYGFGITINTIKQSQTMFARRAFELMASNTLVISNYSRAVRCFFGDLVVCSDNADQLRRRLAALTADETSARKLRLLALRQVMRQHTYQDRLDQILGKLGLPVAAGARQTVALFAVARSAEEHAALLAAFRRQAWPHKRLFLVTPEALPAGAAEGAAGGAIHGFPSIDRLIADLDRLEPADAFAGFLVAADHYGEHYLTDLALAARYSGARAFTKGCHFARDATSGEIALIAPADRYSMLSAPRLALRASLVRGSEMTRERLARLLAAPETAELALADALAVDEFNYCRNGTDDPAARALTDDPAGIDVGWDVDRLLRLAEGLPAGELRPKAATQSIVTLSPADLLARLEGAAVEGVSVRLAGDSLVLDSRLAAEQRAYVWAPRRFDRQDLNLVDQNTVTLTLDSTSSEAKLVFEYFGRNGRKISHSMIGQSGSHTLVIPEDCVSVRVGVRLYGPCRIGIGALWFGGDVTYPSAVVGRAETLVLTKQYPAYDDLYRYGFLHSRLRCYRDHGLTLDVFRLNKFKFNTFEEFEGIDVAGGDAQLLADTLAAGRYRQVLVHLIDRPMWEAIKRHLDRVRVAIWIHGAEIQPWQRRIFDFDGLPEAEVQRRKKLSDQRLALWREIFDTPSDGLDFIYVSRHFRDECAEDVGRDLTGPRHHVIHNLIDADLFPYRPKTADHRLKVLSIRPFSSRKYANDLTVGAILELSKRPDFDRMDFRIVGDGEAFDTLLAPLAGFPNVVLQRGFLAQGQIAELHREYGIFLSPTRMDAQGVSRDEAMASGLVPVTNRIAAVPEFVDDDCGVLVPPEDPQGLAEAIAWLVDHPEDFLRLSRAAAERVRRQSGFDQTIAREIALIRTGEQ